MSDGMTYAVHTEAATYLLDDDGYCRWILSPNGLLPQASSAAVGAQFVACLDLTVPGGLVAELRVGAAALFARTDEDGRYVLLRTSVIHHVESRGEAPAVPGPRAEPAPETPPVPLVRSPKVRTPKPPLPKRTASASISRNMAAKRHGAMRYGAEETLTLVKPFFRPQTSQDAPSPPVPAPVADARPGKQRPPVPAPRSIASPPVAPKPPSSSAAPVKSPRAKSSEVLRARRK